MAGETDAAVAPVTKAARVEALDVLRGVAVLGILAMNITAFGLLFQAYDNPLVDGGATGANLLAWKIINVGFEGTMRGIFSLLFGAGIVLLTERMEQAGAGIMAAEVHFRRMLWMMLFGIVHWTLLLWTGEILFAYSMCGMLLFALRKLSAKVQLIMAGSLLALAALFMVGGYQDAIASHDAAQAAEAAKAGGAKLTAEQDKAIEGWQEMVSHTTPTPENEADQRSWHEGSYANALGGQLPGSYAFQWTGAPPWLIFDMIPFMLIGMGLLKLGVLSAARSMRTYALMALVGYAIGIPLGLREMDIILASNFGPMGFSQAMETYEASRLAMVVGHLGVLLMAIKAGALGPLQRALGAVGQMALSNYLAQTLICTALFYGFGFGLYSDFERYQLYYVVFAIWAAQLVWSPLWLANFRFGPFEWLWRSLTYWKRQPMRLRAGAPAGAVVAAG
ncbi:MAG: DUF418 domain-containing protein [Novosphingobium sp.]